MMEHTDKRYRVVGSNGRRERVMKDGLTRAEAFALAEECRFDPICRCFSVWVEEEPAAEVEAQDAEPRAWHGEVRR